MSLLFLNLALFILLLLLIPQAVASFLGAPFLRTPKKAARKMLEIAKVGPGDKVYDLGSGDGQILIMADKEFGARAFGFELSPLLYIIGQIKRIRTRAKGTKIYFKNFYSQNLDQADVITCFLTPWTMPRLQRKLERELKPGIKVVSYAFKARGWRPERIEKVGNSAPIYFYVFGKHRI